MKKFRYFELEEFIRSDTAKKKGIDNTPTFEVVENLAALVQEILDPFRAAWGKAIRISSGYRCEKLNKAVGGSVTSAHLRGDAADLQSSGSFAAFRDFAVLWFQSTGTRFDQLLLEYDVKKKTCWLHISRKNSAGGQRGEIKVMEVNK